MSHNRMRSFSNNSSVPTAFDTDSFNVTLPCMISAEITGAVRN